MAHFRDWLPSSRTEQLAMARNWLNILETKAAAWGIPLATVETLATLTADAITALELAMSSARNAVINCDLRASAPPCESLPSYSFA